VPAETAEAALIANPLRDAPFDSGRRSDYALSPVIALLPRKERKQSEQDLDPDSWKQAEARHLPVYTDAEELGRVEETLAKFPRWCSRRGAR
jgi:hypothetical protein